MTTLFMGNDASCFSRAGNVGPDMQLTTSDGLISPCYDSTRVRGAIYCQGSNNEPASIYADLTTPVSEGWIHWEMNNYTNSSNLYEMVVLMSAANANAKQIRLFTSNAANNTWIMQYSSNGGSSWTNISATTLAYGSSTLRRFDINFKFHATSGFLKIYMNDALVWTYTGALVTQNNICDRVFFGGVNGTCYYSQILVTDASDSTVGSHVHTIFPNASGAVSEWSGTYADVDDAQPNLTDMIATNVVDNRILFAYSDINSTTFLNWDVVAVAHVLDGTIMSDATVNDMKAAFRHSDGTEYYTAALGFTKDNTRQRKTTLWHSNPVTGLAWSLADVNNGQFGARAA